MPVDEIKVRHELFSREKSLNFHDYKNYTCPGPSLQGPGNVRATGWYGYDNLHCVQSGVIIQFISIW